MNDYFVGYLEIFEHSDGRLVVHLDDVNILDHLGVVPPEADENGIRRYDIGNVVIAPCVESSAEPLEEVW